MSTVSPPLSRPRSPLSLSISRKVVGRRGRHQSARRPLTFEPLEGRALCAVSPLDPAFNGGLPVVTPTNAAATTGLDTASGVAVQPDGRIVVVGQTNALSTTGGFGLAVRRYNANGTPDTTFGTNGEADITLPATSYRSVTPLSEVLIRSDGTIVVGAILNPSQGTNAGVTSTLVVRLTATGAYDTTFGVNGVDLPSAPDQIVYTSLALAPNGGIVLGGRQSVPSGNGFADQAVVFRQTSDGTTDMTFNGGDPLVLDTGTYGGTGTSALELSGVAATSGGKILVAYEPGSGSINLPGGNQFGTRVAELNADGSLNTAFGTGGIAIASTSETFLQNTSIALQQDGQFLITAATEGGSRLFRFTAAGQPDPSFAAPLLPTVPRALAVDSDGRIVVGLYNAIADVSRYLPSGVPDASFGFNGEKSYSLPESSTSTRTYFSLGGIAVAANGQVIEVGTAIQDSEDSTTGNLQVGSQAAIVAFRTTTSLSGTNNDYDGDNKSDLAAAITTLGIYAYRKSTGGDVVQPFGVPGYGETIPAPGDYDGDGKTDIAAYLPSLGILAYRPSSGGADVYVRFGPTGLGNAIPVPGDYNGDGKTDVALFLPASATFVIDPSNGLAPYAVQYGAAGAGQTIPVPADYDGDGTTDFAVYVPALGDFFHRLSTDPSTANYAIAFGPAGIGASVPAPADYEGTGRAQFAVYLPGNATFAVMDPDRSTSNFAVRFGVPGYGDSVPAPGDYDGDGKADFAVYLPATATFAYRPSSGGSDFYELFGVPGVGQTIPAAALPIPSSAAVQTMSLAGGQTSADPAVFVPLVDTLLDPTPSSKRKRT